MTKPSRRTAADRTTIRDIAAIAGVSAATVSRALNDRSEVSKQTRDAVIRVARSHNYSANRSARGLSGGRTGLVGLTLPNVHAAYFAAILGGATEALYEQDMRVLLCPTGHEHAREVSLLDRLMHGTTDGALIVLPEESSAELSALYDERYPFVVVDPRQRLEERIPAVSAAHASGATEATTHLLELGHRRIGVITGPSGWLATEERRRGYHAAMAAGGATPDPALEIASDFKLGGGNTAAGTLLDLDDPPTAIFAFNDPMAIGVMHAASARGLRVPEDLSIVGFDDTDEASLMMPMLTTVRQPLAEMSRMAVNLLIRLLANQRFETMHVELATKLVVRSSTAGVRSDQGLGLTAAR
jgi:LacI family transcriptional regulator